MLSQLAGGVGLARTGRSLKDDLGLVVQQERDSVEAVPVIEQIVGERIQVGG